MRKTLCYNLLLCLLLSSFVSCKKGDDDPLISMKSRKNRITGEWKAISGKVTRKSENIDWVWVLQNNDMDFYDDGNFLYEYNFEVDIKFNKDNTFEYNFKEFGNLYFISGFWSFMQQNKENDLKSKEAFLLSFQEIETNDNVFYKKGHQASELHQILKLSPDELVISSSTSWVEDSGEVFHQTEKYSFIPK